MITTEIKPEANRPLYEVIREVNQDGFDICDNDWDWGTYFGCEMSWEKCRDFYEKCMLLFALNIKCIIFNDNWYSPCLVKEFIWENKEVFTKFFNEENKEDYRPMDYEGHELDPNVDDGFYEAYMEPMESLIEGNYSERQYKKLFEMLTKEVK